MDKDMVNTQRNKYCFFGIIFILFCATNVLAQAPGSVEQSGSVESVSADICPEPKRALSNSPDDLSKIQEEITRLNLCVQRAQLLERLNSLVIKNIQTIDSAIESNFSLSMPEVSIPPITAIEIEGGMASDNSPSFEMSSEVRQATTIWKIKDIKGGKGKMEAVLVNNNQNTARLRVGDKLPDGSEGTVYSIGMMGVEVKANGKIQRLQWVN